VLNAYIPVNDNTDAILAIHGELEADYTVGKHPNTIDFKINPFAQAVKPILGSLDVKWLDGKGLEPREFKSHRRPKCI